MGWLKGGLKMETGTARWQQFHDCLEDFAKDMWTYFFAIDSGEWDPQKVNACISAIESDLRRAQDIWPEGRAVLGRMSDWFARIVRIREEEHNLFVHRPMLDCSNFEEWQREFALWHQAFQEIERKLKSEWDGLFGCCDEVKKWTSIDLKIRLQGGGN